jgi:hypothetical protein
VEPAAYLIHDRDAVYGRDFDAQTSRLGISGVRTPPRAPKANSIAERLVAWIRRECLDHVVVINERHLRTVLSDFVTTTTMIPRIERSHFKVRYRRRVEGTGPLSRRRG